MKCSDNQQKQTFPYADDVTLSARLSADDASSRVRRLSAKKKKSRKEGKRVRVKTERTEEEKKKLEMKR